MDLMLDLEVNAYPATVEAAIGVIGWRFSECSFTPSREAHEIQLSAHSSYGWDESRAVRAEVARDATQLHEMLRKEHVDSPPLHIVHVDGTVLRVLP